MRGMIYSPGRAKRNLQERQEALTTKEAEKHKFNWIRAEEITMTKSDNI